MQSTYQIFINFGVSAENVVDLQKNGVPER